MIVGLDIEWLKVAIYQFVYFIVRKEMLHQTFLEAFTQDEGVLPRWFAHTEFKVVR